MVGESENKQKQRKTKMKKNTKKVAQVKVQAPKAIIVKPTMQYTKDEVRSILKLSKGSSLSPKYYPGMGGRGKVAGTAVIAYLENARRVKVGRRYPSGSVTVVAR
jgi:hypothetical protein